MAFLFVPGNASPSQVLAGRKFSAGSIYGGDGTMQNHSGAYIPTTLYDATYGRVAFEKDSSYDGYHDASTIYMHDEPNLQPYNIPKGITMFGIEGKAEIGAIDTRNGISFGPTATVVFTVSFSTLYSMVMTDSSSNIVTLAYSRTSTGVYQKTGGLYDVSITGPGQITVKNLGSVTRGANVIFYGVN